MKDPDIHDWGKMRLVLQFVNQIIRDYRVIGDDNTYEVLTYLDASYAMHGDMRGHNGDCMTFGWGLTYAKLFKKKLNTKISIDSEVVGSRNYIPLFIWWYIFMKHQGYRVKKSNPYRIIEAQ